MRHPNAAPDAVRVLLWLTLLGAWTTGAGCGHAERITRLEEQVAELQVDARDREAAFARMVARLDEATDERTDQAARLDGLERDHEAHLADAMARHAKLEKSMTRAWRRLRTGWAPGAAPDGEEVQALWRAIRARQVWGRYADLRLSSIETRLDISPPPPPTTSPDTSSIDDSGADPSDLAAIVRQHLEGDDPSAARELLEAAMDRHQGSPALAELRYLEGETWFVEGRWGQAASVYQLVTESHPESAWSAWSLVRLGQCFAAMGEPDTSRIYFDEVQERYPGTEAAEEARRLTGTSSTSP